MYVVIAGSGHQALCDVALLLPQVLNEKLLKNVLPGTAAKDVLPVVNGVILDWLKSVQILSKGVGEEEVDERSGTLGVIRPKIWRRLPEVAGL